MTLVLQRVADPNIGFEDTALGCTIPAGSLSCTDLVDSVSFADADLLRMKAQMSASASQAIRFQVSLVYELAR